MQMEAGRLDSPAMSRISLSELSRRASKGPAELLAEVTCVAETALVGDLLDGKRCLLKHLPRAFQAHVDEIVDGCHACRGFEIAVECLGCHVGIARKVLAGDSRRYLALHVLQDIGEGKEVVVLHVQHGGIVSAQKDKESLQQQVEHAFEVEALRLQFMLHLLHDFRQRLDLLDGQVDMLLESVAAAEARLQLKEDAQGRFLRQLQMLLEHGAVLQKKIVDDEILLKRIRMAVLRAEKEQIAPFDGKLFVRRTVSSCPRNDKRYLEIGVGVYRRQRLLVPHIEYGNRAVGYW